MKIRAVLTITLFLCIPFWAPIYGAKSFKTRYAIFIYNSLEHLEDFNDNILTKWQVPQTTGTFTLMEQDSVLKIVYNRTTNSWEWDNFNFTPPLIDVSNNPCWEKS